MSKITLLRFMPEKITGQILLFNLLSIFFSHPMFCQSTGINTRKVFQSPIIDGKLDDAVWRETIPFSGFKMVEPSVGSEPSEKTELRVIYDTKNLYIGIRCFDSDPKRIASNSMVHDQEEEHSQDNVSIMLDPFQDKRNGYIFIVNPLGARSEGFAQGEHSGLSWDGIWNARCSTDREGWSAEISIPFMTLSFNPKLDVWGINVQRYIARKQEIIRLSGISFDSFFSNPREAASLTGIDSLRQGYGITFRPYGITGFYRNRSLADKPDWKADAGFDIYKNITPNLVAAFTLNTDFAETEVDQRRLNLTRFPLFYPEKRTFFLEGSDIFDFGSSSVLRPFFSRRVGLFEGEPVPLNWGVKTFGKIGKTNIAMLDVQTGKHPGLPSNNLFAGRVSRNILEESKIGVIFTNGEPTGKSNKLAGVDFVYATSRFLSKYNFSTSFWSVYNWNEYKGGKKEAFGLKVDYPNDLWDVAMVYNYVGDSISPGIGFLPRNAYHYFYTGIEFMPRPEKGLLGRFARQWFFELRFFNYWNLEGKLESRQIFTAPINIRTESGEHIEFNIIPNREVLPYDFEVSEDVVIPKEDYRFINYRAELNTAGFRRVKLDLSYRFGEFYNGHYNDFEAGLTCRLDSHASLEFLANFVNGRLPAGNFSENVYMGNLNLYLNPDLGIKANLQFDDVSDKMGFFGKFFWQVRPGNTIYLVYNSNWMHVRNPKSQFIPGEDKLSLKVQLNLRI